MYPPLPSCQDIRVPMMLFGYSLPVLHCASKEGYGVSILNLIQLLDFLDFIINIVFGDLK